MNDLANLRFDRHCERHVAAYRPKFYIRQPFPNHCAVAHVIRERTGADYALAILAVRAKPEINPVDTSVTRHARERGYKNFGGASAKFGGRSVRRDMLST